MLASESGSGFTCETRATRRNGASAASNWSHGLTCDPAESVLKSGFSRSAVIVGWATGHHAPPRGQHVLKRRNHPETDDLLILRQSRGSSPGIANLWRSPSR